MQIYIKYESLANFSNIVAKVCVYEPLRLPALSVVRQAGLGCAIVARPAASYGLYTLLAHVVYYSVFVVVFIHFPIIDNDSSDIVPFMSLYSEILPVLQI